VPEELYKENKLPNMAIVLNDLDSRRDGYGATEVKKPWYRRIS